MTIYIGGIAAMFACLALILAVPDMQAVINGTDKDPVTTILNNAFGPVGSKMVMGVVMISFISCVISLQAAASRLLYSYARDEMVIGSALLKRLSPTTQVPVAALFVSGVLPALIIALGFFLQDAVATIVSYLSRIYGLRAGDLVVFGTGRQPSHAGIYVGEGRFVHAPSTGGTVRLDRLDNRYWARQPVRYRRP